MKSFMKIFNMLSYIILIWHINTLMADISSERQTPVFKEPQRAEVIIDSVAVYGTNEDNISKILPLLISVKGNILNQGYIEHDRNIIETLIRDEGWWNVHVNSVSDTLVNGKAILSFNIETGNPVLFGDISVKTFGKAGFDIPSPGYTFYGKKFISGDFEKTINEIKVTLSQNGYPEALISPLYTAKGDTVFVEIEVIPGNQANIDLITVTGLIRTKPSVILKPLKNIIGMKAEPETIVKASKIISGEGIASLDGDPEILYTDDGKAILEIRMLEQMQGSFDGALGYQPSDDGGGEIIGRVNLLFPNIGGTGRYGKFRWENSGNKNENLEVKYREPWLLGMPYSVSGGFSQEQRGVQDYTKTTMQVSVVRKFGLFQMETGYRYEKVSADSLNSSGANGIDAGILWENTDYSYNPSSGVAYAVRWSEMKKKYNFGMKESHSVGRIEFDLDHYIISGKKKTTAILIRYRHVDIPEDASNQADKFWLGGSSDIRGYREKSFPAVKAIWATAEYRFLGEKTSRTFIFIDSGYLENYIKASNLETVTNHKYLTGYGFGFRIDSKAGTLGFDYGLGRGDGISQGKLHVSLMNSF